MSGTRGHSNKTARGNNRQKSSRAPSKRERDVKPSNNPFRWVNDGNGPVVPKDLSTHKPDTQSAGRSSSSWEPLVWQDKVAQMMTGKSQKQCERLLCQISRWNDALSDRESIKDSLFAVPNWMTALRDEWCLHHDVSLGADTTTIEHKVRTLDDKRTMLHRMDKWRPRVTEAVGVQLDRYGIAHVDLKGDAKNENTHPVSAAIRAHYTVAALRNLCADHKVICDYYGSPRTSRLFDEFSSELDISIEFGVYRPVVVAGDINRLADEYHDDMIPRVSGWLMVDVYATEHGPLTPEFMAQLMTPGTTLFWIGHRFPGTIGTTLTEGAWMRKDDMIVFRSDSQSLPYPMHDPCDWIHQSNGYHYTTAKGPYTMAWATVKAAGNYCLVRFETVPGSLVIQQLESMHNFATFSLSTSEIPVAPKLLSQKLLSRVAPYLPFDLWSPYVITARKQVLVRIENTLLQQYSARNLNALSYHSATTFVHNALRENAEWQVFHQLFPAEGSEIVCATVQSAFSKLAQEASDLRVYNEMYSTRMAERNEAINRLGKPIVSTRHIVWFLVVMVFLFAVRYAPGPFSLIYYMGYRRMNASTVLVAVLIEETVKRIMPWVAIPILELFFRFRSDSATSMPQILALLAFHWFTTMIPFPLAVLFHFLVNYVFFSSETYFEDYRTHHYIDAPAMAEVTHLSTSRCSEFPQHLAKLPTTNYVGDISETDNGKTVQSNLSFERDPNTHFYALLPVNVPGYVPRNSACNLEAVMMNRLAVAPPLSIDEQRRMWGYSAEFLLVAMIGRRDQPLAWEDHFQAWYENAARDPIRRVRYSTALVKYEEQGEAAVIAALGQHEVMIKTNEMLFRQMLKHGGSLWSFKPRALINVAPIVQVALGPYVNAMTNILKDKWHIEGFPLDFWPSDPSLSTRQFYNNTQQYYGCAFNVPIYVTWGAGRTDVELTAWMEHLVNFQAQRSIHIIAAGDDVLIGIWHADGLRFWEMDASMFDQSQGIGPLMFQMCVMETLGCPQSALNLFNLMYHAPLSAALRGNPGRVLIQHSGMRMSGGPDTTFGNTVTMIAACIKAFLFSGEHWAVGHRFVAIMQQACGFKMKFKEEFNPQLVTFLKGKWYEATLDAGRPYLVWGPLPSRILKVGKCLKDPVVLYKQNSQRAARMYLCDQAAALANFFQPPVLKSFIRAFSGGLDTFHEPHKPVGSGVFSRYAITDHGLAKLADFYDVPCEWFSQVELLMPDQPFHFLEHDLFVNLSRDYL